MKILMVSKYFPPIFGGASVQAIRLSKALLSHGCDVRFFVSSGLRETVKNDTYEGLNVTRVKTYSDIPNTKICELIFSIKLVLFVLLRPEFKILHFHAVSGVKLLTFPLLRLLGKKIVLKLTLVGVDDPLAFKQRRYLGWLYILCLKQAHVIIAISEKLKIRALEAGVNQSTIAKIYNGYDEETFFVPDANLKSDLRQSLGIPEQANAYISIGSIEYRKGYDVMLEAFADIQQVQANAVLFIVGQGNNAENSYYQGLLKIIKDKHLNNIFFVGGKKNVHEYLKAADCFLFCSRQEGFGTVIVEAMACGLPTVVMPIEGVTDDIIADVGIGAINNSMETKAFADLALQMVKSKNSEVLKESIQSLRQRFSMAEVAKSYIELYRHL